MRDEYHGYRVGTQVAIPIRGFGFYRRGRGKTRYFHNHQRVQSRSRTSETLLYTELEWRVAMAVDTCVPKVGAISLDQLCVKIATAIQYTGSSATLRLTVERELKRQDGQGRIITDDLLRNIKRSSRVGTDQSSSLPSDQPKSAPPSYESGDPIVRDVKTQTETLPIESISDDRILATILHILPTDRLVPIKRDQLLLKVSDALEFPFLDLPVRQRIEAVIRTELQKETLLGDSRSIRRAR